MLHGPATDICGNSRVIKYPPKSMIDQHVVAVIGGAPAQPPGPLGAAGEHDQELAAEPELALELAPLLLVERGAAELSRDRQPEEEKVVQPELSV